MEGVLSGNMRSASLRLGVLGILGQVIGNVAQRLFFDKHEGFPMFALKLGGMLTLETAGLFAGAAAEDSAMARSGGRDLLEDEQLASIALATNLTVTDLIPWGLRGTGLMKGVEGGRLTPAALGHMLSTTLKLSPAGLYPTPEAGVVTALLAANTATQMRKMGEDEDIQTSLKFVLPQYLSSMVQLIVWTASPAGQPVDRRGSAGGMMFVHTLFAGAGSLLSMNTTGREELLKQVRALVPKKSPLSGLPGKPSERKSADVVVNNPLHEREKLGVELNALHRSGKDNLETRTRMKEIRRRLRIIDGQGDVDSDTEGSVTEGEAASSAKDEEIAAMQAALDAEAAEKAAADLQAAYDAQKTADYIKDSKSAACYQALQDNRENRDPNDITYDEEIRLCYGRFDDKTEHELKLLRSRITKELASFNGAQTEERKKTFKTQLDGVKDKFRNLLYVATPLE